MYKTLEACVYGLGMAAAIKFCVPHEIGMAEGFVYMMLLLVIFGYWAFSAWLQRSGTPSVDDKLSKDVDELKTKVNGLIMRDAMRR